MSGSESQHSSQQNVMLISSDRYYFILPKAVALKAGMLSDMLAEDSVFSESKTGVVRLDISGAVLEKVVEYLLFKFKYEDCTNKDTIPDFQDRIPPELALELLVAADYLQT